jgi:O-antigen/teichoic acid export membrane protein
MVRRLARRRELYPALLGHNLILTLASGIVLTIGVTAGLAWTVQVSPDPVVNITGIALFTGSSVVLFRWIVLAEQVFLGCGEFGRANLVNGGFSAARAATALVACLGFGVHSLITWMLWHTAIHALGTLACAALLRRYPRPEWRILREEIPLGFHACTPIVFDSLRQNIDRLVLAAIATPDAVGVYSAATRLIQTSAVSVTAMARVIYPKLAVAGEQGLASAARLVLRYLPLLGGVAALTSLGIYLCADILPMAFGAIRQDHVLAAGCHRHIQRRI